MKKKLLLVVSVGLLVGMILAVSVVLAKDFTDLDSSHWAYSYVSDLTEKGVISGYEDNTYRPNGTITRAEFFKLVVCCDPAILASGEKMIAERGLELEEWYDKYVYTAYLMNLQPYIYESGDMEKPITRVEMAGILDYFSVYEGLIDFEYSYMTEEQEDEVKNVMIKYAKELGYVDKKANITIENFDEEVYSKISESQLSILLEKVNEEIDTTEYGENDEFKPLFCDIDYLNAWDIVSVNHVKTLGIIKGYEDGTFQPYNEMTRAETAVVISNYLKLLAGGTL